MVQKIFILTAALFSLVSFFVMATELIKVTDNIGTVFNMSLVATIITLLFCLYLIFTFYKNKYGLVVTISVLLLVAQSVWFWLIFSTGYRLPIYVAAYSFSATGGLISIIAFVKLRADNAK